MLRVNAAGIIAKMPGQHGAIDVTHVLLNDHEVRQLYMTAVTARVCGFGWDTAERLSKDPYSVPDKASFLAARFADEATNPRDVGARWCSAVILRDISLLVDTETRRAGHRSKERRAFGDHHSLCERVGVTDDVVTSLIGAVDTYTVSTMPAEDASADVVTDYVLLPKCMGWETSRMVLSISMPHWQLKATVPFPGTCTGPRLATSSPGRT